MSLSMNDPGDDDSQQLSRSQKPWLLPSTRKLRHLQAIALRNIVVDPPVHSRARGKTIDDDNVPNTLQTPGKRLSVQEARGLQLSRSATDLKHARAADPAVNGGANKKDYQKDGRASRRRSTLPWTGVTPAIRQMRLEDIACTRLADTWFSVHCDGISAPVYISEVVEKALNPNFRTFDLNPCGPAVSRQSEVTLKFWSKTANMPEFILLLELRVNLGSLQYIGKSLDSFHHPLPANCVVFQFPDGIYTSLTDLAPLKHQSLNRPEVHRAQTTNGYQPTSSYDALMRLANLDDCIQDALATREKLEAQMNAILELNQSNFTSMDQTSQAQERLSAVKRTIAAERIRLRQSNKRRDGIIASLKARRDAMLKSRESKGAMETCITEARTTKESSGELLKKITTDSFGQIRRICEDLGSIYPIEPITGKPLAFRILNIHLPNSDFTDMDKESVGAALGYCAHLVYLLSFYLSVPLPYPVQPYLSTSYIQDPVSLGIAQRTFPLYPVNARYRFEYGVFLLNKDIEYMMNRLGLRVLDIRHTLPNLKYLLYMLTADTSEVPARKAGGVRGLFPGRLMGRGVGSPSLSRRGSEDSVATTITPTVSAAGDHIRFHSPSPPPHKLNGSASRGWQVGRDGPSTATTMPTTATAMGFIGFGQVK